MRKGILIHLDRGVCVHVDYPIDENVGFQVACARMGQKSVIGELTALFYYNLIDEVPEQSWILVPPGKRSVSARYRLIRTKTSLKKWVNDFPGYRIASVERAILEGFKLSTKVGLTMPLLACRMAFKRGMTTPEQIARAAKDLNMYLIYVKHREAILTCV